MCNKRTIDDKSLVDFEWILLVLNGIMAKFNTR